MKTTSRFIASTVATSAATTPALPWARGTRRAAFIAKRAAAATPVRKSA